MVTTTLDPISLNEVNDPENAPFHLEHDGDYEMKICFETEENRRRYLDPQARVRPWLFTAAND